MPDMLPPAPPIFASEPAASPSSGSSSEGNGLAVAGLVMGILAVVLCWVMLVNFILGVLGIIFGALGMAKAKRIGGKNRGMALSGLILGIIGIVLSLVFFFVVVAAFKDYAKGVEHVSWRLAKRQADRLAFESYPEWSMTHADKACPASIDELMASSTDPWGHPFKMMCGPDLPAGAKGIAILSFGEDGIEGTSDDIKSWELLPR